MPAASFFSAAARPGVLIVLVGLWGWLAVGSARADAADDGFARGNRLYAAGKYAEAATAYETQVSRGSYSANLFYNLGGAYYRVGDRGRAILNYQRALLLEPSHAEAAANLGFVSGKRSVVSTNGDGFGNVEILSWLTAAACWTAAAGALMTIFQRRRRTTGVVLMVTGLLGAGAGVGAIRWETGGTSFTARALVIADGVPALYSPADNSKVVTKVALGTEVRVLSAQGAWLYALLDDGTRAWMPSDKVQRLVPAR